MSPTIQKPHRPASNRGGRRASHTGQARTENNIKAKGDRKRLDGETTHNIKECRKKHPNMSYDEIADRNGVSKSTAWRIVNQPSVPGLDGAEGEEGIAGGQRPGRRTEN